MSLLLGSDALKYIIPLNEKLNSQALLNTKKNHGFKFSNFEPWMTSERNRIKYGILAGNFEKCTLTQIVSDIGRLKLLRNAISESAIGNDLYTLLPKDKNRIIMKYTENKSHVFENEVRECLKFLNENSPNTSIIFQSIISHIIPLEARNKNSLIRLNGSGFSTHEFRGCIFISLAETSKVSRFENMLNLVHELGHQVFFIYQCTDPILTSDLYQPIYSVIRKVKRPAIQSLHALVASAYMFLFCKEIQILHRDVVDSNYFHARQNELENYLYDGLLAFKEIEFTRIGKIIFNELSHLLIKNNVVTNAPL